MTFSFNLIDQPWIPVLTLDGQLEEHSLRDTLVRAHEFEALCAETPLMTAALMPLLLAVLHRVFGPHKIADWEALWNNESFPAQPLDAYFAEWYDRFDLFHPERPFYQVADDRVLEKSVIHMIHSIGNTGTLFIHTVDEPAITLAPAQAARYLLTAQQYRTAGLSGLKEKFTDSTLTRGVGFWAASDSLFKTLLLNLMPVQDVMPAQGDQPIWERDDPFAKRNVPTGYLDYLTWPGNRILLLPVNIDNEICVTQMTIAPGLSLNEDVLSPQKRYTRRAKKNKPDTWGFLYFNEDRALWRDFDSLLMLDNDVARPPAVLEWLAELSLDDVINDEDSLRLTAMGMLANQAKPMFYRQEHMPLSTALLRNAGNVRFLSMAIGQADEVAGRLSGKNGPLQTLADHALARGSAQNPDPNDREQLIRQWDALSIYWAPLESAFWQFVDLFQRDLDLAQSRWREAIETAAHDALEHAIRMAGREPWTLKGQVIARRKLNYHLREVFEPKQSS